MKKLGSELEFISLIKRDGSGTEPIEEGHLKLVQTDTFNVTCLSLTQKTFIASAMSCFVVKLKPIKPEHIEVNDIVDHIIETITCPCGGELKQQESGSRIMICTAPNCKGKFKALKKTKR